MRHMLIAAFTLSASVPAILGINCSPVVNTPPPVLDHAYVGRLDLLYTQELPQISASAWMNVQVDRDGQMTFQPCALTYDNTSTEGDSRIRRSGTINLAPTGSWFDSNGVDRFSVDENGSGSDRLQQWVFDGVTWQLLIDETFPINWHGGLAFTLDDAVLSGSVVEANAGIYQVRWTLTLTPVLE